MACVTNNGNVELAEITNGSLVNNEWSGTAIFDQLINAVNKNIEAQYNKGRITGNDYANVYLGSMQSVIAQSVQYVLQEPQALSNAKLANRKVL